MTKKELNNFKQITEEMKEENEKDNINFYIQSHRGNKLEEFQSTVLNNIKKIFDNIPIFDSIPIIKEKDSKWPEDAYKGLEDACKATKAGIVNPLEANTTGRGWAQYLPNPKDPLNALQEICQINIRDFCNNSEELESFLGKRDEKDFYLESNKLMGYILDNYLDKVGIDSRIRECFEDYVQKNIKFFNNTIMDMLVSEFKAEGDVSKIYEKGYVLLTYLFFDMISDWIEYVNAIAEKRLRLKSQGHFQGRARVII